jgi:hypothetical protein
VHATSGANLPIRGCSRLAILVSRLCATCQPSVLPAMSDILLRTCGWSYAEWEGILYRYAQDKLRQYSSIFLTAEIDSTFYSPPREGMVLGWTRNTPRGFVFSAKLAQTVTHKKGIDPAQGRVSVKEIIRKEVDSLKQWLGGGAISESGTKISVLVAILLVILALIDLRISAGLATIYLIAYAINRLRRRKPS